MYQYLSVAGTVINCKPRIRVLVCGNQQVKRKQFVNIYVLNISFSPLFRWRRHLHSQTSLFIYYSLDFAAGIFDPLRSDFIQNSILSFTEKRLEAFTLEWRHQIADFAVVSAGYGGNEMAELQCFNNKSLIVTKGRVPSVTRATSVIVNVILLDSNLNFHDEWYSKTIEISVS